MVNALHESELDRYLQHFNIADDFHAGNLKCFHTEQQITLDNLFGFFKHEGRILAISDDAEAIEVAYQLQRQGHASRYNS